MLPYFGLTGVATQYNELYDTYSTMNAIVSFADSIGDNIADTSDLVNNNDIINNIVPTVTMLADAAEAEVHNWYDQCGFEPADWTKTEEVEKTSTGWTVAYKYNAIINLILLILTVLMLCCIVIPGAPANFIFAANGCIICLGTPLLAGPILAAVRAGSELGTACGESKLITFVPDPTAPPTSPEDLQTFADDATILKTLFIVQFVFLCPMQCCAICGGQIGYLVCNLPKFDDGSYHKQ